MNICKVDQVSVKSECMRIIGNLFEFFQGANNYLFSNFQLLELIIANLLEKSTDSDLIWNCV
jgi:hypothetical protein